MFPNSIIFSMAAAVVVVDVDVAIVVTHVVALVSLFPKWMVFFILAGFVSIPVLAAIMVFSLSISFVVLVLEISQSNCSPYFLSLESASPYSHTRCLLFLLDIAHYRQPLLSSSLYWYRTNH